MQILIDNRDGKVWEIPASKFSWKTERVGKAGTLEVSLLNNKPLEQIIVSGAIVRIKEGKHKIFYGYKFKEGFGKSSEMNFTAYDQLRYLMFNDTFVFKSMTASAAIKTICSNAGLTIGKFDDTAFKCPAMVEDDKKAFDVVSKYIDSTLIASHKDFILYDNFGKLDLRKNEALHIDPTDFYIGEESLLFDFEYEKSIDDETYNRIKLVKDDKKTSKRKVYIAQDTVNTKRWGTLQYFKKVDENMTDSQIKELLNALAAVHNGETEKLSLKCLGDWRIRAGVIVLVYIKKLGIKQVFRVDACTHEWVPGVHTMDLELKVVRKK